MLTKESSDEASFYGNTKPQIKRQQYGSYLNIAMKGAALLMGRNKTRLIAVDLIQEVKYGEMD